MAARGNEQPYEGAPRADGRDDEDGRVAIAIDLGTTGLKLGLVTLRGRVLWGDHCELVTTRLADGGAEQDAARWWDEIVPRLRRGLAAGVCSPSAVAAVSVTGQWASSVPVAADGEPVGPVMMWMDTRARGLVRKRFGGPAAGYKPRVAYEYIRRSGGAPALDGADPNGHRLYLREQRSDVWRAARWILEPVDYLTMRFTGEASATAASMTASWLCDTRDPAVTTYDSVLAGLSGADTEKLPPLRSFGSIVGTVAAALADELGIGRDVVVVTGSPDLHTAALGSGAVREHEAHMAVSTTSWISAPVPTKKTDVLHAVATVPGLTDDRYLIVNTQETAGRSLHWLRDLLASGGGSERSYEDLTALAATSPPGANGVVFTPWLDGERSPVADRRARAGFHRLSLGTDEADLVRAVLEGVACNARWLLTVVERFAGRRLDPIRVIGGGARSDLWCQIYADVFDRTIEQVDDPIYGGLRGAAFLAGLATGELARDEVRGLAPVRAAYAPRSEHRSVYDRGAAALPKIYAAEKRVFRGAGPARRRALRRS